MQNWVRLMQTMRDLLGHNWFQEKINWVKIDFTIK
jgi:hypothetical protein